MLTDSQTEEDQTATLGRNCSQIYGEGITVTRQENKVEVGQNDTQEEIIEEFKMDDLLSPGTSTMSPTGVVGKNFKNF